MEADFKEPIEISANTYLVGKREGSPLERNVYLRVFKAGGKSVNMVIDPGPPTDFEVLSVKLAKVIEDPKNVQIVFLNHQDPDVSYNTVYFQKLNPNLVIVTTQDTWRVVKYFGLNDKNFRAVESFPNYRVMLSTGQRLIFVPTPFLHSKGACMVYDPETQILFSGDFFGGLSSESSGIYATDKDWDGIKAFHQIYMPSKEAIGLAINAIRKLEPPPLVIAAQHGSIIEGELVERFIIKMQTIEVGIDLIKDTKLNASLRDVLNEIISAVSRKIPKEKIDSALKHFTSGRAFPDLAVIRDGKVMEIKFDAVGVFTGIVKGLINNSDPDTRALIKAKAIKLLLDRDLPLIDLEYGDRVEVPELFEE
ncbi:MAG: MBL fold metallo-hydrolase [Deltaproteobacteria bacterium]|nr:MBL fold metallo-hydrolase [Deltaproteobacteria bacterium]MCL5276704.1 MBL fold metallo-hydrolase [Deltaproteobacteria bacterium]